MHVELGIAVVELRRRLEWSQTELAHAIDKHGTRRRRPTTWQLAGGNGASTHRRRPSEWLWRRSRPSGHEDLAALFRAPVVAWHLVATLRTEPVERSCDRGGDTCGMTT